jgi:hypothetical protein
MRWVALPTVMFFELAEIIDEDESGSNFSLASENAQCERVVWLFGIAKTPLAKRNVLLWL